MGKVISKIRIFNPNKQGSKNANLGYLRYIATRPGVVIADFPNNLESLEGYVDKYLYELDNSLTSLKDDNINNDGLPNDKYLSYINFRPRSHGLFGNIDTEDLSQVSAEIYQKSKDKNVIYRGVISLTEEDAAKLGYLELDKWQLLLNNKMPDIAKVFNIPIERMRWVAAFHNEKGHPHVHYMLWDEERRVKSPFIHISKQNECREILSNEIFKEEIQNNILLKTTYRNAVLDFGKDKVEECLDEIKNLFLKEDLDDAIPNKIYMDNLDDISRDILNLVNNLPDKGRINYAFMPPEVKNLVDTITLKLFSRADIQKEVSGYLSCVDTLSLDRSSSKAKTIRNKDEAFYDLKKRIGNIVLYAVKDIRNQQYVINSEILEGYLDKSFNKDQALRSLNMIHDNNILYQNLDSIDDENLIENISNIDIQDDYNVDIQDDYIDTSNNVLKNDYKSNYLMANNFFTQKYKDGCNFLYGNEKLLIEKNFSEALKLFMDEAENGNPLALYNLGTMYQKSLGTDINVDISNAFYKKAFEIFEKYSDKGINDIYFNYRMGKMCFYGQGIDQDLERAASLFKYSSDNGNIYAMYSLGKMYYDGKGVDQDFSKAYSLLFSSAFSNPKRSNTYALYETGLMLFKGIGIEQNTIEGQKYLSEALNQFINDEITKSDDNLQYRIGNMYYNGYGSEKNIDKAIEYLKKSSVNKNNNAQYLLAKIYISSNDEKLISEAIISLNELAEKGNVMSQYALGHIYSDKTNPLYDELTAKLWLEKAVENNNTYAKYNLAKLYLDEDVSFYDFDKGMELMKDAAEDGNSIALYTLGKIYSNKEFDKYNLDLALYYYEKADFLENDHAQYALGILYSDASNVFFDSHKAYDYFLKSSNHDNMYASVKLSNLCMNKDYDFYNPLKAESILLKHVDDPNNDMINYSLGNLYLQEGSPLYDIDKAVHYLRLASDQNNMYAKFSLSKIYLNKDESYFDLSKSVTLLESINDINLNTYVWYNLGCIYQNQDYLYQDESKSLNYFLMSSNEGNLYAVNKAVNILMNNESINYNPDKARDLLLNHLNDKNNDMVLYSMGKFYTNEKTPFYDIENGIYYLNQAAYTNSYAQLELAKLYLFGNLVNKDIVLGNYWLEKSIEHGNQAAVEFKEYYNNYQELYMKNFLITSSFRLISKVFNNTRYEHENMKNSILNSRENARRRAKEILSKKKEEREL